MDEGGGRGRGRDKGTKEAKEGRRWEERWGGEEGEVRRERDSKGSYGQTVGTDN